MRKNRLAIVFVLITALLAVLGLSGCSEQTGGGTPLSQAVSGEEPVIWYECQNKIEKSEPETEAEYILEDTEEPEAEARVYGRETRVVWVKVYKDGKLTSYACLDNVNLGHFSKMTDEEILKELEKDTDTYLCGQKDQPYEVYLYTDAAGQEVLFEGIPAVIRQSSDAKPMYFMTLVSKDKVTAFQVYDSYYGGYELYNYDETMLREACLVTRCEKGASFGLDSMELEGAVLDYLTPEEMLHEKNTAANKKGSDKKTETKTETSGEDSSGEEGDN